MIHPEPHDLTALAYALVSGPEREQLLEHIAACDACREAYDAAFEEQSLVRDVMMEEVRSGEAEARALEKVLQALKSGAIVKEEARVFSLFSPFAIGLQIAAALTIAAGVFYVAVVLPGDGETPPAAPVEAASRDKIEVKGGDVLVAANGATEPDKARWTRATSVPLGVLCRNDNAQPITFSLDGAALQFESGAYFQLQPTDGQVAVYVLRGDASVSNSTRGLRVLTNTNDFYALPDTAFEVECGFAFVPSERGKQVEARPGQTLVRAEVTRGKIIMVPFGEPWDSPRGSVVAAGKDVKIRSELRAALPGGRKSRWRALGGESDEATIELALKGYKAADPEAYNELVKLMAEVDARMKEMQVKVEVRLNNVLLIEEENLVQINDGKRHVSLVIDNENYLCAIVEINGQTEEYKVANLDELAEKCPAIADLLANVTIETPAKGTRSVSIKRTVYQKQEMREEKQEKNTQKSR